MTRRRLATLRLAAATAMVVGLASVAFVTTLAIAIPTGILDEVSVGRIAVATASVTGLSLLHLGAAFAAGAVTGRRAPAVVVGSGLAVGGYLIHGLSASAEVVGNARVLSPFWWTLDRNLLVQDPTALALGLPLVLAIVAVVVGVFAFERRDLRFP